MIPTIAVIVPALAAGGGVPAVADFLCTQIERTRRFDLQLFSIATASRDECSLRFTSPSSWIGHPRTSRGRWQGREFTHFGAIGSEFEFRRVAPSVGLKRAADRCDLIQFVSGFAAPALTLTGCKQPIVLQVATRVVVERRMSMRTGSWGIRTWRNGMTQIIDRCDDRALRMVDAVMVENRWMFEHARSVLAERPQIVQHAPPGVDCSRFTPCADRTARILRDPYILFVGRLSDPRKNITLLCRAYGLLCARVSSPPRLVIAGHGVVPPAAALALADARILDRVEIVREPSADALVRLYQHALCLALPSDEEGFGLVVIEAMACGAPVVSTRCGGPEEIIEHAVDGFLVPTDGTEELAAHLRQVSDPALNQEMSRRARQTVLNRFSADVAFLPFLRTYEQLLS